MNKRVFIIHGWEGSPENCWFPWLKAELESRGFSVIIPSMPSPEAPEIKSWVGHLQNEVGEADENTYFVGHSIGCQTILRYVEQLPQEAKIGGIICVAGFFNLMGLETEEEKELAKLWLETKIDFEKIKKHTDKIIAVFSDNDPYVDLENKELFEKNLGAKTIIEHDRGHFSDDVGCKDLPVVLEELLKVVSNDKNF
jgi:predicted alpha/beta hydrolase family esterase